MFFQVFVKLFSWPVNQKVFIKKIFVKEKFDNSRNFVIIIFRNFIKQEFLYINHNVRLCLFFGKFNCFEKSFDKIGVFFDRFFTQSSKDCREKNIRG